MRLKFGLLATLTGCLAYFSCYRTSPLFNNDLVIEDARIDRSIAVRSLKTGDASFEFVFGEPAQSENWRYSWPFPYLAYFSLGPTREIVVIDDPNAILRPPGLWFIEARGMRGNFYDQYFIATLTGATYIDKLLTSLRGPITAIRVEDDYIRIYSAGVLNATISCIDRTSNVSINARGAFAVAVSAIASLLCLAQIMFAALAVGIALIRAEVRSARRRRGLCGQCGYDLYGNSSGTCPECGAPTTVASNETASA